MEAFCWAANINTNGRVEMYSRVAEEFSVKIFGHGIGIMEQMLEYWNVSVYSNLHNDLLKIFIELGAIGFIVFLISFAVMFFYAEKLVKKSGLCYLLGIVVYTMLLFATDNVSIYLIYLIPLYSTIFAVLSSERICNAEEGN
jgi:O-antigen ligase